MRWESTGGAGTREGQLSCECLVLLAAEDSVGLQTQNSEASAVRCT